MVINEIWDFKQAVDNIRAIKQEYLSCLSLFSYIKSNNLSDKKNYIHNVRSEIYKIRIDRWQIEKLWEFMNDDLDYIELYNMANRQKKT